jgi:hypothetical protein
VEGVEERLARPANSALQPSAAESTSNLSGASLGPARLQS